MRCTSPRTVGFESDGKTIAWSQKKYSKQYASFQLPCGKCIECRLDYARQWAVRCVHEAQMHEKNCFITLTYSDKNLKSPRLIYEDWQKFMKKLRKTQNEPIGVLVTGEYGDDTKRPHWHAILFNYAPPDMVLSRKNIRGDRIYNSKTLDKLWGHNDPKMMPSEIGDVTFESAGYVARYATKKIVHGQNQKVKEADFHDYQPISKKSSKHAIGKKWLEKYWWTDCFSLGQITLPNGSKCSIPRYYQKWFQENHPEKWRDYVTKTKLEKINLAESQAQKIMDDYHNMAEKRGHRAWSLLTPNKTREIINKQKLQILLQKEKKC